MRMPKRDARVVLLDYSTKPFPVASPSFFVKPLRIVPRLSLMCGCYNAGGVEALAYAAVAHFVRGGNILVEQTDKEEVRS